MLINDNASTNTATSTNDAPKPEQVNSTSAVTKESAVRLIENLVNERQQWQEAVYKTSNDMLYGLLQRCYGLYSTMCEKNNDGKAAREGFALYLERNKLAFKKGTHTLTMIVRCVFGNDRRRVSGYSIVLRRALADGVKPFDLPAFIRNAGGVEEVRLAKSPTVLTPKQRSDIAATHVDKGVLATVKAEALSKCLDLAKTGERLVLIATQQADGEVRRLTDAACFDNDLSEQQRSAVIAVVTGMRNDIERIILPLVSNELQDRMRAAFAGTDDYVARFGGYPQAVMMIRVGARKPSGPYELGVIGEILAKS